LEILRNEQDPIPNGIITASEIGTVLPQEVVNQQPKGVFQRPSYNIIAGSDGGDFVFRIFPEMTKTSAADPAILEALKYMKAEDYTNALSCLHRAIKIDPKNAKAYFYQGNMFAKLVKYQEAIKSYQTALQIDPNPEYVSAVSRLLGSVATYIEKKEKGEPEAIQIEEVIQKNVDHATNEAERSYTLEILRRLYPMKEIVTLLKTYVDSIIIKYSRQEAGTARELAYMYLNNVRLFKRDYYDLSTSVKKYLSSDVINAKSDEVTKEIDDLSNCFTNADIEKMDPIMTSLSTHFDDWAMLVQRDLISPERAINDPRMSSAL
jgi:tetratricopeptide (TPR) repeat protein